MTTTVAETAAAPTHLLCVLGPLTLGFEALAVREVMTLPLVAPLSEAAPLVAGAVNLRGRVVPLLDLRAALGLELTPPAARESLVVLESAEQIVAVRVDEVRDVQLLSLSGAPLAAASDAHFVAGLARDGANIVQLVNLTALFAAAAAPASPVNFDAHRGGAINWRAVWFAPAPAERAVLEMRAQALARPFQTATGAGEDENALLLAAATLDGEFFGFDLGMVREFAPLRSLTRVPLGPPSVLGLLNLRGEILPLLDIRHALGMDTRTPPRLGTAPGGNQTVAPRSLMEVVVVEHEARRVAVWVEQVLDVFAADAAHPNATAPGPRPDAALLRGVVPYGDKILAVLNLPALLEELTVAPL